MNPMMMMNPYHAGGNQFTPYGMAGMNPKQYRKQYQQMQARGNPKTYMPGGNFIANADKRKAWKQNLKEFNQNKPWKDQPAPAAPVPTPPPVTV